MVFFGLFLFLWLYRAFRISLFIVSRFGRCVISSFVSIRSRGRITASIFNGGSGINGFRSGFHVGILLRVIRVGVIISTFVIGVLFQVKTRAAVICKGFLAVIGQKGCVQGCMAAMIGHACCVRGIRR
jgi:hypothetical protein